MKIYIASSFDLAERCDLLRKCLEFRGHEIRDVWWNVRTKDALIEYNDREFYSTPIIPAIAARHWKTIDGCDALILVGTVMPRTFTGANVEVGYAIAKGKPVLSLGALKRSAMYVPIIKCDTVEQLLDAVDCISGSPR